MQARLAALALLRQQHQLLQYQHHATHQQRAGVLDALLLSGASGAHPHAAHHDGTHPVTGAASPSACAGQRLHELASMALPGPASWPATTGSSSGADAAAARSFSSYGLSLLQRHHLSRPPHHVQQQQQAITPSPVLPRPSPTGIQRSSAAAEETLTAAARILDPAHAAAWKARALR